MHTPDPDLQQPPSAPHQALLGQALDHACACANADGGVVPPITPRDFGIQRSPAGYLHATYIGDQHAVSVKIHPDNHVSYAVAHLQPTVEAIRWTGTNAEDLTTWTGEEFYPVDPDEYPHLPGATGVLVADIANPCPVYSGDWIVKRGNTFRRMAAEPATNSQP